MSPAPEMILVAAKAYVCDECKELIEKGSQYVEIVDIGQFHSPCWEKRKLSETKTNGEVHEPV